MTGAEIELGARIRAIEDWCLTHTGLCRLWIPSFYLPRILLTQPWLTRSCLEMSQGRTPWWASSTIRCLTTSGRGLPFTNTPPSWFTPPCPAWDTTAAQGSITLHTCRGRLLFTSTQFKDFKFFSWRHSSNSSLKGYTTRRSTHTFLIWLLNASWDILNVWLIFEKYNNGIIITHAG